MNCIRHPLSAYAKNDPLAVLTETKYNFLKLLVVVVVVGGGGGGGGGSFFLEIRVRACVCLSLRYVCLLTFK